MIDVRARLRAYGPAIAACGLVGFFCARAILRAAGEPSAPLDDAFIHLQYARRLAEGHFFSYVPGEGYSSGATSLLWPILLAPFHLIGLRGVSLLYAAWLLGGLAHAALTVETWRLARRLAGEAVAAGAFAMSALFGAFAWFAWSGMETVALGWILLRAARVAGAFCEPEAGRPRPSAIEVLALGVVAPLIRPEGAVASVIAAVALLSSARGARARLLALAPLAGPFVVPLLHLAFTGHAASSTARVKWMIGNPYYDASAVIAAFGYNARMLVTSLIDGGDWTVIFLPEHSNIPILLGAVALPIAAMRRRAPYHAIFVAMVALGALIPCTYLSFLWNRLRYIWPFAGAWFVMVACLAREIGDLVRLIRPRFVFVGPLVAGGLAGAVAMRLPWAIKDLAQSAAAIQKQQVTLGRWVAETLPPDARVGVNDTGAIAYLGGRRTFDVVGLTTEGEARYWAAGAGSRFEHYEKMPRERLPTHFVVYPQWMMCSPVLGKQLMEATVLDQSILGGATMVAYEARWDVLGTGALPAEPPGGQELVDELDVADLESEAAHDYDLSGATDTDDVVVMDGDEPASEGAPQRRVVADGGRLHRALDRFRWKLPAGRALRMVMRVGADAPVDLVVSAGGREIGAVTVTDSAAWVEPAIDLPAEAGAREVEIIVRPRAAGAEAEPGDAPRFHAFHYWLYAVR